MPKYWDSEPEDTQMAQAEWRAVTGQFMREEIHLSSDVV